MKSINESAIQAEQGPTRKKRRRRKSTATLPPVAVSDGVARVAAHRTARISFRKLGVEKRVRSLVAVGNDLEPAAEQVAKTAKGILAERELAASISARAGLVGSLVGAHPNPITTHPTDDIILTSSGVQERAIQVKNGLGTYVQRNLESGKYGEIVANREAVLQLEQSGAVAPRQVPTYIDHAGVQSIELSAADTHQHAKELLVTALQNPAIDDRLFALVTAAKSGATDGIATFGFSVAAQVVDDLLSETPIRFGSIVADAARVGAKATLRTSLVTYSQALTLLRRARNAFSSRLIRIITSSTLVMSAVADVVVEFAFDVVGVVRGKIDMQTLFRNLGVNACGALGGLGGAGLALLATRGAPWWVTLVVLGLGLWGGTALGRRLGVSLFDDDEDDGQALLPAT